MLGKVIGSISTKIFKNLTLGLALTHSTTTSDLFAEVFRDTTRRTVSFTTVTFVVVGAFHPASFAWSVLGQFLAFEARSFNVGIAVAFGFTGTGSDKSALFVLVASEKRLAGLHGINSFLARSLSGFEFRGVSGRAQLHHRLALPSGLSGTSTGFIVSAVDKGRGIGSQDSVGHHSASLLLRVDFVSISSAQNGKNHEKHHFG